MTELRGWILEDAAEQKRNKNGEPGAGGRGLLAC